MSEVKKYKVYLDDGSETEALCVLASDYDRDTHRLSDESHRNRVDLVDAVERSDKLRAERDELRAQAETMRALLVSVSTHLDCYTFAPFGTPLPPEHTERRSLSEEIYVTLQSNP